MHSSPVLSRLAADLTGLTDDDPHAALWIVHVVLSPALRRKAVQPTPESLRLLPRGVNRTSVMA